MESEIKPVYSRTFFNSANESNPEAELALSILMTNIIEVATAHANLLGIGNPSMTHLGAGWVLSRITIEMTAYPPCNSQYSIDTWIENWNRHFSTRNFCIHDTEGNIYGYARSVWMVLDTKSHENFGLAHLSLPSNLIYGNECPISQQSKHLQIFDPTTPDEEIPSRALKANTPTSFYTFKYSDIDFYRHVNTVRYLALLLNQYTLEDFDSNFIKRIEISFLHEATFGDTASILRHKHSTTDSSFSLISQSSQTPILFSRISLSPRDSHSSAKPVSSSASVCKINDLWNIDEKE